MVEGGFDKEVEAKDMVVKGWDIWVVGSSGGVEERVTRIETRVSMGLDSQVTHADCRTGGGEEDFWSGFK